MFAGFEGVHRRPKTPQPTPCPPSLFQCKSGECLSYAGKCNGIVECLDASDEESEMCRKLRDLKKVVFYFQLLHIMQFTGIALSTSSYPGNVNIIDAHEPVPSSSRSVSSQTLPKSPLYTTPSRRLFYINGPNSLSSSTLSKVPLPPKTLPLQPPLVTTPSKKDFLSPAPSPTLASLSSASSSEEEQGEESSASTEFRHQINSNQQNQGEVAFPHANTTTTNETSVQITRNADNTTTKKTTNTITTVSQGVIQGQGRSRVINTKTEIVISEKMEINEL